MGSHMYLDDRYNMCFSVKDLIKDAKKALESGAYFSALTLTFALVSECANVKYPDEWFEKNANADSYMRNQFPEYYKSGKYDSHKNHDRERFIMWYDDWYNAHNCCEAERKQREELERVLKEHAQLGSVPAPHLNGELLYQLRCTIFHEASSGIKFNAPKKISDEGNGRLTSDGFILSLEKYNENENYGLMGGSAGENSPSVMNISLNGLICHLLYYVGIFYNRTDDNRFNTILIHDYR